MSSICSQIVWLRGLLMELGCPQLGSTPLYADNTSAIHIAINPMFHERTKHVKVDCHSICMLMMAILLLFHVSQAMFKLLICLPS